MLPGWQVWPKMSYIGIWPQELKPATPEVSPAQEDLYFFFSSSTLEVLDVIGGFFRRLL